MESEREGNVSVDTQLGQRNQANMMFKSVHHSLEFNTSLEVAKVASLWS